MCGFRIECSSLDPLWVDFERLKSFAKVRTDRSGLQCSLCVEFWGGAFAGRNVWVFFEFGVGCEGGSWHEWHLFQIDPGFWYAWLLKMPTFSTLVRSCGFLWVEFSFSL